MNIDIESIKRKMLVKYPFFGSIVANVDYKEDNSIKTAGTDGKTIHYNSEFLSKLTESEQIFVFAHEVCHIAFNHILRSEGKDKDVWNTATDAVINQFLKKDGLNMVKGGVDIEDAINYDAEELYKKLLEDKKRNEEENTKYKNDEKEVQDEQMNQSGSGGQSKSSEQRKESTSSGENNQSSNQNQSEKESDGSQTEEDEDKSKEDVGHDTHSLWEEAVKQSKEQKEENKSKDEKTKKLEEKVKELEKLGEKSAFQKNKEDKKKELEELKKALAKEITQAGTTTNRDIRNIEDIGTAKPIIDWRYILKEAVKYDVDWSYKNATIEEGVITANLEEQPTPETEIVLDTSGSIDEILLKSFLRECKNILKHSKIKVGCFDTEFYGFHEIRNEEDIENMEFVGGGGTDFDTAVGAFSRRVENKIIFTDGDASMPEMNVDAIWIVFGGIKINPKGGRVIYITEEQLDKLYSYIVDDTTSRSR